MRILNFIMKLLGFERNNKDQHIEKRIVELQKLSSTLGDELKKASPDGGITSFHIERIAKTERGIETFVPFHSFKVVSMDYLKEKRRKEEAERRRKMQATIEANFDKAQKLIESESDELAEKTLYSNILLLKKLNDAELNETFETIKVSLQQLKDTLKEREQARILAEIERKKAAEAAERERQQRIKEEEERKRREKEAAARAYQEKLEKEAREQERRIKELKESVTKRKDNYRAYINHLNINNVSCFYHFTDINNINSIKRLQGLYSWHYCEENGIVIPSPGGDSASRSLDMRHSLEDYVRLSFCSDHPMAYSKAQRDGVQLVLLKIKIDVASFRDTLFSDMNAADSRHQHGGTLEALQRIDIDATKAKYVRSDDPIFKYHQAECMVKTYIPLEYIINIDHPEKLYF